MKVISFLCFGFRAIDRHFFFSNRVRKPSLVQKKRTSFALTFSSIGEFPMSETRIRGKLGCIIDWRKQSWDNGYGI